MNLILGESIQIQRLRALIARLAASPMPVLVQGPTGSGKELVAQSLHALSGRPGRMVALNVCAISDAMFEDALFGHVRGAFTGAISASPGYVVEADRGTLFLDEIGGLDRGAQSKLLRVLETRAFRPIGARADRQSDFRLVAATNEDLLKAEGDGRFRGDLRHRFGRAVLTVPRLSDRRDDIPLLASHYLRQCGGRHGGTFEPGALTALCEYDWPGNVRELRSLVEYAAVLAETDVIPRSLITSLLDDSPVGGGRAILKSDYDLAKTLTTLETHAGDVYAAAAELGVSASTVYRRVKRSGTSSLGHRAS